MVTFSVIKRFRLWMLRRITVEKIIAYTYGTEYVMILDRSLLVSRISNSKWHFFVLARYILNYHTHMRTLTDIWKCDTKCCMYWIVLLTQIMFARNGNMSNVKKVQPTPISWRGCADNFSWSDEWCTDRDLQMDLRKYRTVYRMDLRKYSAVYRMDLHKYRTVYRMKFRKYGGVTTKCGSKRFTVRVGAARYFGPIIGYDRPLDRQWRSDGRADQQ